MVLQTLHLIIDYLEEEKPANTDANTEENTKEKPANTNANTKLKSENITDANIKEKPVVVNYHNYQLCFTIKI
jgi:hypothetical protein